MAPIVTLSVIFLVLSSLSLEYTGVDAAVKCIGENGKLVDWFIVYKIPHIPNSDDDNVVQGLGYVYMDPSQSSWKTSKVSINDTNHAVAYTLQQIYSSNQKHRKSDDDVAYAMYNDQPPQGTITYTHGHTKGVVAFDKSSGFWLVHSVPHFPNAAELSYEWPKTGLTNGQSMLCISLNFKSFDTVGKLFLYNYPNFYDMYMPEDFIGSLPSLVSAVRGDHVESSPWYRKSTLKSSGGQTFHAYAKYTTFNEDIFSFWLAPDLHEDLYTETWQNGVGKLPSDCDGDFDTYNIDEISINGFEFAETKDHSKWCVSVGNDESSWVCIGDINRQEGQLKRAGGMVCVDLPTVWKSFRSIVKTVETCSFK